MNFDPNITKQMQAFVNADETERNYEDAALLLLKVSGNKVEYKNNVAHLNSKKAHILARLRSYLDFRLASLTKEQVEEMSLKADNIVENIPNEEKRFKAGKRDDHESLPEDLIAAYKEVNVILQKQKQLHMKMRTLALADAPCPNSEIFPFVKEIIELDKKKLGLWKKYDSYDTSAVTPDKKKSSSPK